MRALHLESWHGERGATWTVDREVRTYGDPLREWTAVRDAAGLFDASLRDRLIVTGPDRETFVQGLSTNDVEKPPAGASFEAAFITPKGKLVADVRITKLEDALLMDGEQGRGAALDELFGKYRIHEDCTWAEASEQLCQLELWGPKAAEVLGEPIADGESKAVTLGEGAYLAAGTPFGVVVFVPAPAAEEAALELLGRVEAVGGALVGREAIEPRRIEQGLGRYGVDWGENTNPLEAGLDRALDYEKGCYVGQEVVAKATYIGRVNRRLVRLSWEGEAVPAETPILGGKAPGRVTSSAQVPGTNQVVAMGVVRRDVAPAGTKVRIGEEGPEATVLGWPWRSKDKPRS